VIRSLPAFEWDTGIYSAFGLRIEDAALVFVKSPSHFKSHSAPAPSASCLPILRAPPVPTCGAWSFATSRVRFFRSTMPEIPDHVGLAWRHGCLSVQRFGGMLGPLTFILEDGRQVSPLYMAPWAAGEPDPTLPEVLKYFAANGRVFPSAPIDPRTAFRRIGPPS